LRAALAMAAAGRITGSTPRCVERGEIGDLLVFPRLLREESEVHCERPTR